MYHINMCTSHGVVKVIDNSVNFFLVVRDQLRTNGEGGKVVRDNSPPPQEQKLNKKTQF